MWIFFKRSKIKRAFRFKFEKREIKYSRYLFAELYKKRHVSFLQILFFQLSLSSSILLFDLFKFIDLIFWFLRLYAVFIFKISHIFFHVRMFDKSFFFDHRIFSFIFSFDALNIFKKKLISFFSIFFLLYLQIFNHISMIFTSRMKIICRINRIK